MSSKELVVLLSRSMFLGLIVGMCLYLIVRPDSRCFNHDEVKVSTIDGYRCVELKRLH